jgi:tetratricopeptide (TPR) repeat protein
LDGLPLAIAQAGAFLQESGTEIKAYLGFYERQWSDLMESTHSTDAPLQDYPERSVWTTWAISYQAIYEKHEYTAKLLLLWSFLDNKNLWYGLFKEACSYSEVGEIILSMWIGKIATSELAFSQAMQLLRNYSLVEEVKERAGYATHPVVHRWAYHYQGKQFKLELSQLAVIVVGSALPSEARQDCPTLQRQLVPHANACSKWILREEEEQGYEITDGHKRSERLEIGLEDTEKHEILLSAIGRVGVLYAGQSKLVEAEQMYEQALQGYKKAFGPTYPSTLETANNLGVLYSDQGKLAEAEQMYKQTLQGKKEAFGPTHPSTLDTINNLGNLYVDQGKLVEAEQMYKQALQGKKEAFGPTHSSTLGTIYSLGILYTNQGKLAEAEQMYKQTLQGYKKAFGPTHPIILDTVNSLGSIYREQGKLAEAEQMYKQALQGKKEAFGPTHPSTLDTINNLGNLYADQGKLADAELMYRQALHGYTEALGPTYPSTLSIINNLGNLYSEQGRLAEAEQMFEQALHGYKEALGDTQVRTYRPAVDVLWNIGLIYEVQKDYVEAEEMYKDALSGYQAILGSSHHECLALSAKIDKISAFLQAVSDESMSEFSVEPCIAGPSRKDNDSKDKEFTNVENASNVRPNANDTKKNTIRKIKKTSRGWEPQPAASQTASSTVVSIPHHQGKP